MKSSVWTEWVIFYNVGPLCLWCTYNGVLLGDSWREGHINGDAMFWSDVNFRRIQEMGVLI